ncbi:MAG: TetR family transcriptional regulator [Actinomycetota bacterium]|nr:TetR family transcriptional regulator [Actinomycetota bacterium]
MAIKISSTQDRLLDVASQLFYTEGINAVGIERVVTEAGVAKATLYAHFASKDELVAAYLARRSNAWVDAVRERVDRERIEPTLHSTPKALLAFDILAERAQSPGYRGCPFINAAAEFPHQGPVAEQVAAHRQRVRETFTELIAESNGDPGIVAMIMSLYDGAMSAAYLDHDPTVVYHARRGAGELLSRHDVSQ